MDFDQDEARVSLFCLSFLPFGRKRPRKTVVQPEGRPTTPELGLVKRLEQENREVKAKADEIAEAKRKLEDELRGLKELLETREQDAADKEESIQRLQKDVSKMRTKVCRIESGTSPES
jgi:predicted RNase H-like nuclease (RuvC/YqgF family)